MRTLLLCTAPFVVVAAICFAAVRFTGGAMNVDKDWRQWGFSVYQMQAIACRPNGATNFTLPGHYVQAGPVTIWTKY
ncbi:MAG: hypothetical protein ABIY70_01485 [Capsulimonas sp.]|uniref:hypothetical protein n=1 Tax=Capsulimonas sp. TaxID=2494211 RepID=UPI0032640AFC